MLRLMNGKIHNKLDNLSVLQTVLLEQIENAFGRTFKLEL